MYLQCNTADVDQLISFVYELSMALQKPVKIGQPIVFACIGSMKAMGDSLAPRIGTKLLEQGIKNVFGYEISPVHAQNIRTAKQEIYDTYTNPFVIAIDASIGKVEGIITLNDRPLLPGVGVGKDLGEIGNLTIAGAVTRERNMMALLCVNQQLIERMVSFISTGIQKTLSLLQERSNYAIK